MAKGPGDPKSRRETKIMWTEFAVEFRFLTKLVGGLPADPKIYNKFLESRAPAVKPPESRSLQEIAEEMAETIEQPVVETPGLYVFQRHQGTLAVRMGTIKAHIKDIARKMSGYYAWNIKGERAFSTRVIDCVYYPPDVRWIPILHSDGQPVTKPTDTYDKPIHVTGPAGRHSAIKQLEFVEDAMLRFTLWVLTQPEMRRTVTEKQKKGEADIERQVTRKAKMLVDEEDIRTLFNYGGVRGYGPERGDGEGKYAYHLERKGETDGGFGKS